MQVTQSILIASAATVALFALPGVRVLARPLVLLATLMHELGHGLAAMLLGGSFERLQLWANGSGAANYRGRYSALALALVAASGPLGPPLASLALFWAGREPHSAHVALATLAAGMLLVALIWVRNLFGFIFVLAFGLSLGLLAAFATDAVAQVACVFLGIQMCLASFSRADYLFKAQAQTGAGAVPSDTAQIAAALGLPYWFWGFLLALISLAMLAGGAWIYARDVVP